MFNIYSIKLKLIQIVYGRRNNFRIGNLALTFFFLFGFALHSFTFTLAGLHSFSISFFFFLLFNLFQQAICILFSFAFLLLLCSNDNFATLLTTFGQLLFIIIYCVKTNTSQYYSFKL